MGRYLSAIFIGAIIWIILFIIKSALSVLNMDALVFLEYIFLIVLIAFIILANYIYFKVRKNHIKESAFVGLILAVTFIVIDFIIFLLVGNTTIFFSSPIVPLSYFLIVIVSIIYGMYDSKIKS